MKKRQIECKSMEKKICIEFDESTGRRKEEVQGVFWSLHM